MEMKRMLKLVVVLSLFACVFTLTGCASVVRGSKQQVFINAHDRNGNPTPCDCILTNDEGVVKSFGNQTATVGRDKDPMTVECSSNKLFGSTTINGYVHMGYWSIDFFLIDMCLISGWVDGLSGAWAEYPEKIDVQLAEKTSDLPSTRGDKP